MKQLTCEMCGSTDLLKQDGVFVCQACGCKYSLEEAKKLMVEGGINIQISHDNEVPHLITLAETADAGENYAEAVSYAEQVLKIDATNAKAWEIKAKNCARTVTAPSISLKGASIIATAKKAVEVADESNKTIIADEVAQRSFDYLYLLAALSRSDVNVIQYFLFVCDYLEAIPEVSGILVYSQYDNYCKVEESSPDVGSILRRRWNDSDLTSPKARMKALLDERYPNACKEYQEKEQAEAYEKGKAKLNIARASAEYYEDYNVAAYYLKQAGDYQNAAELLQIARIEAEKLPHKPKQNSSSGGCYVATAVYGSYDCPQVWTLRRFRDYTLAETWYGRAFIHTYYAISPALVKWFGHTAWFKKMWKSKLDRMVASLNASGVANTPYEDRRW